MWPLQTNFGSGSKRGFELNGYFDATDFGTVGNVDNITIWISSFETDSPSSTAIGIPFFTLMPCEEIRISLALEQYSLLDRPTSRCRDDYPQQLKSILNENMTADLFYNPAFAPQLPYDQYTCNKMCLASYWLPRCGCYASPEIWLYAGMPANISRCPWFGENCTQRTTTDAPWEVIEQCECHPKCNGYHFRIVYNEKIRYSYGRNTSFYFKSFKKL